MSFARLPQHTHDCNRCHFLGCHENFDLYWCGKGVIGSSLIMRYGSDGPEYISVHTPESICGDYLGIQINRSQGIFIEHTKAVCNEDGLKDIQKRSIAYLKLLKRGEAAGLYEPRKPLDIPEGIW